MLDQINMGNSAKEGISEELKIGSLNFINRELIVYT